MCTCSLATSSAIGSGINVCHYFSLSGCSSQPQLPWQNVVHPDVSLHPEPQTDRRLINRGCDVDVWGFVGDVLHPFCFRLLRQFGSPTGSGLRKRPYSWQRGVDEGQAGLTTRGNHPLIRTLT